MTSFVDKLKQNEGLKIKYQTLIDVRNSVAHDTHEFQEGNPKIVIKFFKDKNSKDPMELNHMDVQKLIKDAHFDMYGVRFPQSLN